MLNARVNGAKGRATTFAVVFGISASLLTSAAAAADDAGTSDTGEGSAASDVDGALSATGPVDVSAAILAALALIGAGVLARRRGRAATTSLAR